MNTANQAAQASDWRRRLAKMRTIPGLRAAKPDHGALAPLDGDGLTAASENPDHSEAGRAAAAAALRDRGLAAGRWRLAVPGFIQPADLGRGQSLFFGWGRQVRTWSGRAIFFVLLSVLALAALTPDQGPIEVGSRFWFELFGWRIDSDTVFGIIGLSMLAALAAWLFSSAFRRHPARVLLLRKFNDRTLSTPLERMVGRELRPYGHIATLSDRHIRDDAWGWLSTATLSLTNPLAAIWFVVGAPARFLYRLFDRSRMGPATVLDARDYRNLAQRLRDRIGLNLQVAMAAKEAFTIRTSDGWWRPVVRLLMDSADVIVIDLSQVSAGTAWELDVIRDDSAVERCVFVSVWGNAEEADAALRRWGFEKSCFHYAPDGEMQRRRQFREALLDAMRATHGVSA